MNREVGPIRQTRMALEEQTNGIAANGAWTDSPNTPISCQRLKSAWTTPHVFSPSPISRLKKYQTRIQNMFKERWLLVSDGAGPDPSQGHL